MRRSLIPLVVLTLLLSAVPVAAQTEDGGAVGDERRCLSFVSTQEFPEGPDIDISESATEASVADEATLTTLLTGLPYVTFDADSDGDALATLASM